MLIICPELLLDRLLILEEVLRFGEADRLLDLRELLRFGEESSMMITSSDYAKTYTKNNEMCCSVRGDTDFLSPKLKFECQHNTSLLQNTSLQELRWGAYFHCKISFHISGSSDTSEHQELGAPTSLDSGYRSQSFSGV